MQVATEGQFTLAYGIFPNPTNMKTLIPFLDQIEKKYFDLPKHIVVDAGYSSEQNYDDILTRHKRTPLITYNHYLNEQKCKFKNGWFKTSNWVYDAERELCKKAREGTNRKLMINEKLEQ